MKPAFYQIMRELVTGYTTAGGNDDHITYDQAEKLTGHILHVPGYSFTPAALFVRAASHDRKLF